MLLFDRKKALKNIMGPPEHHAEGGDVGHEIHAISEEAINAVHERNIKGFASAMTAMHHHLNKSHWPGGEEPK